MTSKAARVAERLFGDVVRFSTRRGKFSPLSWSYRTALSQFPPRTWMMLTYFVMRSGPEGLSWQTDKQIAHDLGIGHRKVAPHIKELAELGFIVVREAEGNRYVCLVDPIPVLAKQAEELTTMPPAVKSALLDDLAMIKGSPETSPAPETGTADDDGFVDLKLNPLAGVLAAKKKPRKMSPFMQRMTEARRVSKAARDKAKPQKRARTP